MVNRFTEFLERKNILISDGATGTNLFARGLPIGTTSEHWVLDKTEEILGLHQDFINSGSDIILTCTFGGSRLRLEHAGLGNHFKEINKKAVATALKAVDGKDVLVAGSMGPLGQLVKPYGNLELEEAMNYYAEQAKVLAEAGVDFLLVETQFDLSEAKAAIQGVKKESNLPLVCSFSFDRGTKTMMGVSPANFTEEIGGLGLTALGINCGKSLEDNSKALTELASSTQLPIWFKPNAGLPILDANNNPIYSTSPDEMGHHVKNWIDIGAKVIGGCCGTSPDHLKAIAHKVRENQS